MDEFAVGAYWNGNAPRVIAIELIQTLNETGLCADGIDNDNDMATDCADSDCAGDPSCNTPLETLNGCDPSFCSFAPGVGPNGGDVCSCTIPAAAHPSLDDVVLPNMCPFFGGGRDLVMTFNATGYGSYTVNTCATPGDSSILVLDDAPGMGGSVIACSGDAMGEPAFCAEVGDSGGPGPPLPSPTPASHTLVIDIDEFSVGNYWNHMTARQIDVELIP